MICFLLFGLGGILAAGAHELWLRGTGDRAGDDSALYLIGATFCGLLALRAVAGGFRLAGVGLLTMGERRRARKLACIAQGQSSFGTDKDARRAKLRGKGGVFIAKMGNRALNYTGPGSGCSFAPPRSGKTTGQVMQAVLRMLGDRSLLINDPKLEVFAVCAAYLEKIGYRVILSCAWWECDFKPYFSEALHRFEDAGFDPFRMLRDDHNLVDDLALIASALMPADPRGSSENSQYFRKGAEDVLTAFALWQMLHHGVVKVGELRRAIMRPVAEIGHDIVQMLEVDAFSGHLAEVAGRISVPLTKAPKEGSAILGQAAQALQKFSSHSAVGKSAEKAGLDFTMLKDEQPTAIFLGQPPEKAGSHGELLGAQLRIAQAQLARDRRPGKVLIVCDEIANISGGSGGGGNAAQIELLRSANLLGGNGVQCWFYYQHWAQAKALLGDKARELLGLDVICAWGLNEPESCKMVSELCGSRAAEQSSLSSRASLGVQQDAMGLQQSFGSTPLIRPEEVRLSKKMFVFARGARPFHADVVPYFKDPEVRRRAAPNPYERKSR